MIVTSLRPANTLANISPDLRSRLSAGLSLHLAAPAAPHASVSFAKHPSRSAGHSRNKPQRILPAGSMAPRTICSVPYSKSVHHKQRPKHSLAIRPPASTARHYCRRCPPLSPAAKAAKKPISSPINRHRPRRRHLPGPRIGRFQLRTNRPQPSAVATIQPSSTTTAKSNANAPMIRVRKRLPGTAVEQGGLAVGLHEPVAIPSRGGRAQQAKDLLLRGTGEHRRRGLGERLAGAGSLGRGSSPSRGRRRSSSPARRPTRGGSPGSGRCSSGGARRAG